MWPFKLAWYLSPTKFYSLSIGCIILAHVLDDELSPCHDFISTYANRSDYWVLIRIGMYMGSCGMAVQSIRLLSSHNGWHRIHAIFLAVSFVGGMITTTIGDDPSATNLIQRGIHVTGAGLVCIGLAGSHLFIDTLDVNRASSALSKCMLGVCVSVQYMNYDRWVTLGEFPSGYPSHHGTRQRISYTCLTSIVYFLQQTLVQNPSPWKTRRR